MIIIQWDIVVINSVITRQKIQNVISVLADNIEFSASSEMSTILGDQLVSVDIGSSLGIADIDLSLVDIFIIKYKCSRLIDYH